MLHWLPLCGQTHQHSTVILCTYVCGHCSGMQCFGLGVLVLRHGASCVGRWESGELHSHKWTHCEFERNWVISQHGEPDGGTPPGPETDWDHLMKDNLSCSCPKIFEMANVISLRFFWIHSTHTCTAIKYLQGHINGTVLCGAHRAVVHASPHVLGANTLAEGVEHSFYPRLMLLHISHRVGTIIE